MQFGNRQSKQPSWISAYKEDRNLVENIQEVPEREKGRGGERKDDAKHDETDEGPLYADEFASP